MAQKKSTGGDVATFFFVLLILAFSYLVAALYFLFQFAVTILYWGFPIFALVGYRLLTNTSRNPPELLDPTEFDSSEATQQVERLIGERDYWANFHEKQYAKGKENGVYRTQSSSETRFDLRSPLGRELNANLDSAEANFSRANAEIEVLRENILKTLPPWRRDFDLWVKVRSFGLAFSPAIIAFLISLAAIYVYRFANEQEALTAFQDFLLWNPLASNFQTGPSIGAALVTYLVFLAAIPLHRKRLRKTLDTDMALRWIYLFLKWSPDAPVDDFFSADRPRTAPGEKKELPPESETWREILGVGGNATAEDVKSAYRERMKWYHSDRVAGLGQKLQDLAEEESKKINIAYEEAKKELGLR